MADDKQIINVTPCDDEKYNDKYNQNIIDQNQINQVNFMPIMHLNNPIQPQHRRIYSEGPKQQRVQHDMFMDDEKEICKSKNSMKLGGGDGGSYDVNDDEFIIKGDDELNQN